jgi:phosphoribosylglycinamide formyltransferase-1
MKNPEPVNIAIFASGAGSNAKKIIEYFRVKESARVELIVTDQPRAGVLQIADQNHISTVVLEKDRFFKGDAYLPELQQHNIGFIVLAGFMRKIPSKLISAYPRQVINIHPALLPKFGGKGMYGFFVHEAVLAAGEKESGITIHFVDEIYDNGEIIFQKKCKIDENETPESLALKIHELEHANYPAVIEKIVLGL